MLRTIAFILLTIFIFPSDCLNQSIVVREPSLCVNEKHKISLFGTRIIPMTFNRTLLQELNIHTMRVYASISDRKVLQFENHQYMRKKTFYLMNNTERYNNQSIIVYNLKTYANYMNRTYIDYFIETINMNNGIHQINCSVVVMVSPPQRVYDRIFKMSVPFVVIFISIQMGILLDIAVLKELTRRPIQVLIGFVCQYMLMPLIAFSITKIFRYKPIYGLGLFVVGCCPGGSISNQWTIIFDGDINLSAFMSFASSVASFFMMPIWLYTLGQYAYLRELKIRIPFFNLAQSLLRVIGPLLIGMILVYFIPKLKLLVQRIVKPLLIFLIIYILVFGSISTFYLFRYLDLKTALTAPLLPWIGFLLGGFFAAICKQDRKRIVTIGIETGIQNVGIAFMILLYSLPEPENIQSGVIPLIVAFLSTQPFNLILIYRLIRQHCCKPVIHESVDTLSKTTHQLSEVETEPLDNIPQTRKISIPLGVADLSADSNHLEIQ